MTGGVKAEAAGYRAGQGQGPQAGPLIAARPAQSRAGAQPETAPTGARPVTTPTPKRRAGLAWPRLPVAAELATIGAGYAAYSLVRLAIRASRQAAFAHAAWLWQAERRLHLTAEPYLNHVAAAHSVLAEAAGYYYGLLHFLVTPLVLGWLYLRRPAAFPRLRSVLVLGTAAANVVFWVWPAAPPRFSVPGMTDILVTRDILGAAHPRGATSLVNLYAAMPSLHVAWAAWCALAVVTTTRGWWRHLAWVYPAATTLVVLASANHFLLDAVGGLALAGVGMFITSQPSHLLARRLVRLPRQGQMGCARRCWALAVGRPPAGDSRPLVSFTRELRCRVHLGMAGRLWMAVNGLWGAAAVGLYASAGCLVGSPARGRRPISVAARGEP